MPIIGKVGRRSKKVKFLNGTIHTVLLLGAITMIYPFMMMISASFKSPVDSKKFSVYPQYFFEEEMLFKKYIEARMNEESNIFTQQYKNNFLAFEYLTNPETPNKNKHSDWMQFLSENKEKHTVYDYYISEQFGRGIYPRNDRLFRKLMKDENERSLMNFNQRYGTGVLSWDEVHVEERDILSRNFSGDYQGFLGRFEEFKKSLPLWHRVYATLDGDFISKELMPAYRGKLDLLNQTLGTNFASWNDIVLNETIPDSPLRKHWINYVQKIVNIHHVSVQTLAEQSYKNFMRGKYEEIELLNTTYKKDFESFEAIEIPTYIPRSGAMVVDWIFFIENVVEPEFLKVESVEIDFRNWLQAKYLTADKLNDNYSLGYTDFKDIVLSKEMPKNNLRLQADWLDFVRNTDNDLALGLLMTSQAEFIEYLQNIFPNGAGGINLTELNEAFGTKYTDEVNIYPSDNLPKNYKLQWLSFVREIASGQFITIDSSQQQNWQIFLKDKYGSVEELNQVYQLVYHSFEQVDIDHHAIDYFIFKEHKKTIFREFTKRNYAMVLDVMLYNGRAIINTLIYCSLAILVSLIVNPLAAYAMSRFKLRATYKIILILMLTMAFPPMVMGIPSFLILKKLNLLNTFLALILPAAADGYFIFLLKGFFDSLPKELFESATIDGAGETRIFWQIAMQLSKPIMAVIALGAFNAAYRNFMFAFIVCQDSSMWTMMVHIYQLMQRSAPGVGFAALVIAAIPTFAVFVFFQNIIIRGIVVPTEK
jgi:ABC-type glycerol-3-phosphate transport system permease component